MTDAATADEETPLPSQLHSTKVKATFTDQSEGGNASDQAHTTDLLNAEPENSEDTASSAAEVISEAATPEVQSSELASATATESTLESLGHVLNEDEVAAEHEINGEQTGEAKASGDVAEAKRPAAGDESSNAPTSTEVPVAVDASNIAPTERPKGKSKDSAKPDAKSIGDAKQTTASSSSDVNAPNTDALTPASEALNAPTTTGEAPSSAAVDVPIAKADGGAPTAPVVANASTERLGAMLAQRRARTDGSAHGQPLTESQQARLVQRVARAFDTARMRGEAEIRLRLSPPDLGSLKLEVRVESGVMTARLEVETVAAQQALADNLGALKQRLTEHNIRIEQFDIDLMDRRSDQQPDSPANPFAGEQQHASQRNADRGRVGVRSEGKASAVPTTSSPTATTNSGLDVLM